MRFVAASSKVETLNAETVLDRETVLSGTTLVTVKFILAVMCFAMVVLLLVVVVAGMEITELLFAAVCCTGHLFGKEVTLLVDDTDADMIGGIESGGQTKPVRISSASGLRVAVFRFSRGSPLG